MSDITERSWMRKTLLLAGLYNVLFGLFVLAFPSAPFRWFEMEEPLYPMIWQCVGMIVGVYGLGYALASVRPFHSWIIVFVGLVGKVLGPIGFLFYALQGTLPWEFGVLILLNDIVWWVPFYLILSATVAHHVHEGGALDRLDPARLEGYMEMAVTQDDETIAELSRQGPVLLVFLRHFGCTFCREALADLAARRREIELNGTRIVVVHMSRPDVAAAMFEEYGLLDLDQISDPECELYRAFGLERGDLTQLFGPMVWARGFVAGVLRGHGVGHLQGDGFRMPGVFLVNEGRVVREYRHERASSRPDYAALSLCTDAQPC